ncbi:hypothetical protein HanHA300_Chr16g0623401 [Helianthus annuus]|nr:hypothetical protein HanHA300_Chr16g0623401 [Helianthus annuus]KAJ0461609.1 hypothetical protein HanHA89_Chr16g0674241 [Helianthus annuus]KAJ0645905.1 hypothetical protein HanOQP8_Chr16g0629171 [Helianthus annuus]
MGLLKHIQLKGVGGVTLTSSLVAKHEDTVLDPTAGDVNTGGREKRQPEVSGSSTKRQKLVKEESNVVTISSEKSHESIEKDDADVQSSRDTGPRTDNVVLKTPGMGSVKRRGKKIVFSESGESSDQADHDTGPHPPMKRGGTEIAFSESGEASNEGDLHVLDRVRCLSQLVGSVPGLVTSWYERKVKTEARLRDRISRYRLRMTDQAAKNAKLAKKVRKLKKLKKTTPVEKGTEAIRMLAKNTIEHAKVVEALEKELENARAESVEHAYEKLKQANEELEIQREMAKKLNGELELEKDGRRQECESLQKSLERVSSERQWLIQEGFEYVINRLHKSREYLGLLGAVQSNLWDSGAHYGLEQCYESCKDGVALEDASLYNPGAHERFLKAVHELEHTRFPYVVALSQCADRSLDDLRALEPTGLEKDGDEVAVDGGGSGGNQ